MNYIIAIVLGIVLVLLYQKYSKNKVIEDNVKTKELMDELQKKLDENNVPLKTEEEKQAEIKKELEDAKTKTTTVTTDAIVEFLNDSKR